MRFVDEFRDVKLVRKVAEKIRLIHPARQVNLMEVCGTHTQNFFRFGLDKLIPRNVRLISGPGCPVCVSPQEYIDGAIKISGLPDTIILTFGDMLRIPGTPGTSSTLEKKRADGADVRVVYSPLDSIDIARKNPEKRVVFLAVGFETTVPTIALTVLVAKKEKLKNIFFLCALKTIPAAMKHLCRDKSLRLDGFLCPGHVSSIIGTKPYEFLPKSYKIGCCVAGFEPLDIMEGIYLLLRQVREKRPSVQNQYIRVVKKSGNPEARKISSRVFRSEDALWRGLGIIPGSGLRLKKEFRAVDAGIKFQGLVPVRPSGQKTRCICGRILKGLASAKDCPLFARRCTPENPIGPCMVSHEGACNAYYKYKR
jgi:hydrogenase expression/formation protein HypD